jgi:hypothetical protein
MAHGYLQKRAQAYAQKRQGKGGRFAALNPCYGCGKSAGEKYLSHDLTDNGWEDLAICLCEKCAEATGKMTDPLDFVAYAVARGGMTAEDAERIKPYWMKRKVEGSL